MKNKNMMLYVGIAAVVLVVGFVLLSGSKKSSSTSTTPSSTTKTDTSGAVSADKVEIKSFAFGPASITVKVGTTVTWTNTDDVKHTVTADTESADAPKSELFGKGLTYSYTFKKAGTYAYHCEPHPYMKGTVVVTE
jgi:amicyanin